MADFSHIQSIQTVLQQNPGEESSKASLQLKVAGSTGEIRQIKLL